MNFEDKDSSAPLNPPSQREPPASSSSVWNDGAGRPLPADLRVPWDWVDLLIVALLASVSVVLVIPLFLVMGFAMFGIGRAQLSSSVADRNLLAILDQVVLSFGLLAYLAAQIRMRVKTGFWRTIGWLPLETGRMPRGVVYLGLVLGGMFVGVVTSVASSAFPPKRQLPIQVIYQDRHTAILFMLMAVLLAPVVEETLFRGYIYPVIARAFGIPASVIVTGTLFGLLHSFQLWGGWWLIGLIVLVGIVFTFVRAVTHTVLASFLLHVSYNSFQVIGTLVASHGLRHLPAIH
jgi:membrane protease YdiL (CAAX protease family)